VILGELFSLELVVREPHPGHSNGRIEAIRFTLRTGLQPDGKPAGGPSPRHHDVTGDGRTLTKQDLVRPPRARIRDLRRGGRATRRGTALRAIGSSAPGSGGR
jgi:hypothetical protein